MVTTISLAARVFCCSNNKKSRVFYLGLIIAMIGFVLLTTGPTQCRSGCSYHESICRPSISSNTSLNDFCYCLNATTSILTCETVQHSYDMTNPKVVSGIVLIVVGSLIGLIGLGYTVSSCWPYLYTSYPPDDTDEPAVVVSVLRVGDEIATKPVAYSYNVDNNIEVVNAENVCVANENSEVEMQNYINVS